ncbi:MAG TPA: AAA family ATPase [Burkholderiales bacterium]|nr:AAA family ATPase [Burkholderiales bacterium]
MNDEAIHRASGNGGEAELAEALLQPTAYPHSVGRISLIETHISRVFLTGEWAYKVKKPVNLGFLDFTTLDARRRYCEEELRLNRRLAPTIYQSVVEIRGSPERPRIEGTGPVLDYAVKMREFPQGALASEMLDRGELTAAHVDALALCIAQFHGGVGRAGPDAAVGAPEAILKPALDNFGALEAHLDDGATADALRRLRGWTAREYVALRSLLAARRQDGFVRECHGDLHLRNIVILDGRPVPFDCIEFEEALRWVDVMSEIAFVVMDFADRQRADLGWRFLNAYIQATGDYAGLAVLRFYLVYRSLVRAKVHALRARQSGLDHGERERLECAARDYVALAQRFVADVRRALVITHGVSGSGKTWSTQSFIETAGAIRVRSDIERKRLHGLAALARSDSAPDAGIYTTQATRATYERLLHLADLIVCAGYPVLVDAAFLERRKRNTFRDHAARLHVPFAIVAFDAPVATLRARVARRLADAADASEADLAILERQLAYRQAFFAEEAPSVFAVDTREPVAPDTWKPLLKRLALPA